MPSAIEVRDWHERDVVSSDGEVVGKLVDVYVGHDGEPEFLLVSSGFLHHRLHLVPAEGSTLSEDAVKVNATRAEIEGAPHIAADDELSPDEERRLFEYYGRSYDGGEGVVILRRFVLIERR